MFNHKKRTSNGNLKSNDYFESSSTNDYVSCESSRKKLSQLTKRRLKISTVSNFIADLVNDDLTENSSDSTKNLISDTRNGFLPKFFSNLKNFLCQSVPYDTTILFENGKRLNAHRIMLENSSAYFKRKFEQFLTNQVCVIKLNEINDVKMVKVCIDFIYSGGRELNVEMEKLYELQVISEKLELNDLSKLCDRIIFKIGEENAKHIQKETIQNFIHNEALTHLANLNETNLSFSKLFQLAQLGLENKYNEIIESNKLKQISNPMLGIQISGSSNLLKPLSSSSLSCSPSSMSSISSLSPASSWSISTSPVQDEKDLKNTNSYKTNLFEDSMITLRIKDYLNEKVLLANSAFSPVNSLTIDIDTIGSQFSILNKYIYPSMIENDSNQIKNYLENFLLINYNNSDCSDLNSEFKRDSFIVFCIQLNEQKINNLLLRSRLNFADFNDLKNDLKRDLEAFLIKIFSTILSKDLKIIGLSTTINRVFYLKKPANCKTIRLDQMKTSTDCFRAIVEYSRFNELNEKPIVFTTINASVSIKFK